MISKHPSIITGCVITWRSLAWGGMSSGNALFVVMEEGLFPSVVSVFGLVLLQSRLVVVINLSE